MPIEATWRSYADVVFLATPTAARKKAAAISPIPAPHSGAKCSREAPTCARQITANAIGLPRATPRPLIRPRPTLASDASDARPEPVQLDANLRTLRK